MIASKNNNSILLEYSQACYTFRDSQFSILHSKFLSVYPQKNFIMDFSYRIHFLIILKLKTCLHFYSYILQLHEFFLCSLITYSFPRKIQQIPGWKQKLLVSSSRVLHRYPKIKIIHAIYLNNLTLNPAACYVLTSNFFAILLHRVII